MRNLIVAIAAVGGGWLMAHCAQQWAVVATTQFATGGPNPTMGLFIGPAALFGALGGALLAGLLLPR